MAQTATAHDAFHFALNDIRNNTNNPRVIDATYQLEVLSAALWPEDGRDRGEARDRWADYGLTPFEARIMDFMVYRMGKTVSNDRLMSILYFDRNPDDWPSTEITKVFICKLRKKLIGKPYRIVTSWGAGHRMELAA